jgi:two-component system, OmpR family, response regulator TctD
MLACQCRDSRMAYHYCGDGSESPISDFRIAREPVVRLLIIEDDLDLGEAVVDCLRQEGHAVDWQRNGADADDLLRYQDYDAIVIDIGLPGMDGLSVLAGLRRRADNTPVLILTARSQIEDRVDAFDLGADDYLSKPFDVREFQARCRALLRRSRGSASDLLVVGNVVFDGAAKTVRIGDTQLTMPSREFRLLEILLGNLGRVLTKEQIALHLFDFDHDAGPNAIEVYVGRLRKKLGEHLSIRTIRGMGYVAEAGSAAKA